MVNIPANPAEFDFRLVLRAFDLKLDATRDVYADTAACVYGQPLPQRLAGHQPQRTVFADGADFEITFAIVAQIACEPAHAVIRVRRLRCNLAAAHSDPRQL